MLHLVFFGLRMTRGVNGDYFLKQREAVDFCNDGVVHSLQYELISEILFRRVLASKG
jgi:hypothetical protein